MALCWTACAILERGEDATRLVWRYLLVLSLLLFGWWEEEDCLMEAGQPSVPKEGKEANRAFRMNCVYLALVPATRVLLQGRHYIRKVRLILSGKWPWLHFFSPYWGWKSVHKETVLLFQGLLLLVRQLDVLRRPEKAGQGRESKGYVFAQNIGLFKKAGLRMQEEGACESMCNTKGFWK